MNFQETIERLKNNDPTYQSFNLIYDVLDLPESDLKPYFIQVFSALKNNTFLEGLTIDFGRYPGYKTLNNDFDRALSEMLLENKHIKFLTIRSIVLEINSAKSLFKALENNSTIQSLEFISSQFKMTTLQYLNLMLRVNQSLRKLSLHECVVDQVLETIVNGLKTSRLEVLDFSRTSLTREDLLADVIIHNRHLNTINLTYTALKLPQLVLSAVQQRPDFQNLNISHNNIGLYGESLLAEIIYPDSKLKELDISYTNMNLNGVNKLIVALQINTSLQTLILNNNNLGSGLLNNLGKALEVNSSLKKLGLGKTSIGTNGWISLSAALQKNTSLQILDISSNTITSEGFKALSSALANSSLVEIHGDNTNMDDQGCQYLAEALKTNRSLKKLKLGENRIGDLGCQYFAAALKDNQTLRVLDLSSNNIMDKGAQDLAKSLEFNHTLQKLRIDYNNIGDIGYIAFAETLKVNHTLEVLTIVSGIHPAGVMEIIKALEINTGLKKVDILLNMGQTEVESFVEMLNINISLEKHITELPYIPLSSHVEHLLIVNKYPTRFPEEYDKKLINRLNRFDIEWSPREDIHRLYPRAFQRDIYNLMPFVTIMSEREGNSIPPETFYQYIIPQLGRIYRFRS